MSSMGEVSTHVDQALGAGVDAVRELLTDASKQTEDLYIDLFRALTGSASGYGEAARNHLLTAVRYMGEAALELAAAQTAKDELFRSWGADGVQPAPPLLVSALKPAARAHAHRSREPSDAAMLPALARASLAQAVTGIIRGTGRDQSLKDGFRKEGIITLSDLFMTGTKKVTRLFDGIGEATVQELQDNITKDYPELPPLPAEPDGALAAKMYASLDVVPARYFGKEFGDVTVTYVLSSWLHQPDQAEQWALTHRMRAKIEAFAGQFITAKREAWAAPVREG